MVGAIVNEQIDCEGETYDLSFRVRYRLKRW